MTSEATHSELTSADSISVAFDYQYYFFLWKLLALKPRESVGFEVKDDVHTELDDSIQVYYQVKHTTEKKRDGSFANLTALDKDLWKTFSNWAQIISDKNDGREELAYQRDFLKKTSFVLASNKSSNLRNQILVGISDFKNGKKQI